ncbi:MAG: penicillin-binding protein activator LpoB [Cyclonatronaceae bacterium]
MIKFSPLLTSAFILLLSLFMLSACGPSQSVSRVDAEEMPELSGRWNSRDARMVSATMISDVLARPWLERFRQEHDRNPVVIVGRVRNESMEHIDTEIFTKDLERELINSGDITFVASREEREEIRDERQDQQDYASFESVKNLAQELGADFMMLGNIDSIVDESIDRRTSSIFYTVNLELIDVESNQKVWIGNEQIRKIVERSRVR